jgi:hypothetical protein
MKPASNITTTYILAARHDKTVPKKSQRKSKPPKHAPLALSFLSPLSLGCFGKLAEKGKGVAAADERPTTVAPPGAHLPRAAPG